jgi:hypothetical protein
LVTSRPAADTKLDMKYIILTHDLGRPMYFMDHPYQAGFSISTNRERAKVFDGRKEAIKACEDYSKASGLKCEIEKK